MNETALSNYSTEELIKELVRRISCEVLANINTSSKTDQAPASVAPNKENALLQEIISKYGFTLTRSEAAELLRIDANTLDRWRRHGKVRAITVGSTVRFRADDILSLAQ